MSTPQPPSGRPLGRVGRITTSVSRGAWRDMDQAWVMAAEMLSGLFIFGGLGWFVGTRFGGHPFLFIAGSLLGFFAGFYVLYLRSQGRIGVRQPPETSDADDGEAGSGEEPSGLGDAERP